MTVVTRFAPSPTGFLHIGGARTALFNWLFARHHNGKFLLRIEDTDRERSTQAAVDAILDSMKWLGLDWDGDPIFQFPRAPRHAKVAKEMVEKGKAFRCYTTPQELEAFRAQNPNAKFRSPWRDAPPPPGDKPYVIRIRAPQDGETSVNDQVQGTVTVKNEILDDMILLRSDGTPTYMLAVVVDDHDMGVTHVIRGDDHLTNTFRQLMIYNAMGWSIPSFSHVPMILGADGAKLSKRHGAVGAEQYREMGYLPEAMRNYLLRLGWSHGDDETISTQQAIEWFNLESIGKSPSRFDFTKLENLNGHYIREAEDTRLVQLILPFLEKKIGKPIDEKQKAILEQGMNGLKQRAKTIVELADSAAFYITPRPLPMNDKAKTLLTDDAKAMLKEILSLYEAANDWSDAALQDIAKSFAEQKQTKLGNIAQPLRAALSGSNVSPGVFEVMVVLGREEALARIKEAC